MTIEIVPSWMKNLEANEVDFIRKFVLASGSLKKFAADYGVTYPTVRLRLDKLNNKIKFQEREQSDRFIKLIEQLSLEDRIDSETAKILINAYEKEKKLEP